jgi:putative RNA 2'-phosphotransferase
VAARYNPKTLAKTLLYITVHAPAEFGLFWDPDGTMPWKELYWALQEDSSLRFVRESIIRELTHLGLELPFVLDGSRIRLQTGEEQPLYPPADNVPNRLYFACRRKRYAYALEHGLIPSSRPLVTLSATKDLALRLGRRRDPEPLLLEILASAVQAEGEAIYWAGADLYLVASVPARHLVFPLLRADQQVALSSRKRAETKPSRSELPATPGSFFVDAHQFDGRTGAKNAGNKAGKQKGRKKSDWKREAKDERHKRSL